MILRELDPGTRTCYCYEDGGPVLNLPLSGGRTVYSPESIGTQKTYYVPRGESRTLSKNIEGVRRVCVRGDIPAEGDAAGAGTGILFWQWQGALQQGEPGSDPFLFSPFERLLCKEDILDAEAEVEIDDAFFFVFSAGLFARCDLSQLRV